MSALRPNLGQCEHSPRGLKAAIGSREIGCLGVPQLANLWPRKNARRVKLWFVDLIDFDYVDGLVLAIDGCADHHPVGRGEALRKRDFLVEDGSEARARFGVEVDHVIAALCELAD